MVEAETADGQVVDRPESYALARWRVIDEDGLAVRLALDPEGVRWMRTMLKALAEAASEYCGRAAVFTVGDGMIRASYGAPQELEFPVQSAAAFAGVVDSREPAIAAALPAEIGRGELVDVTDLENVLED